MYHSADTFWMFFLLRLSLLSPSEVLWLSVEYPGMGETFVLTSSDQEQT